MREAQARFDRLHADAVELRDGAAMLGEADQLHAPRAGGEERLLDLEAKHEKLSVKVDIKRAKIAFEAADRQAAIVNMPEAAAIVNMPEAAAIVNMPEAAEILPEAAPIVVPKKVPKTKNVPLVSAAEKRMLRKRIAKNLEMKEEVADISLRVDEAMDKVSNLREAEAILAANEAALRQHRVHLDYLQGEMKKNPMLVADPRAKEVVEQARESIQLVKDRVEKGAKIVSELRKKRD